LPVPRVTVTGAVTKPGPVDLQEGLRVRKAVELAGGALKDADLTRVTIAHPDFTRTVVDLSREEKAADPERNRLLEDGDSVEVPLKEKIKITVVGCVAKPGMLDDVVAGVRV